jgi:hypothetical protein
MEIPKNVKTMELMNSTIWFSPEGILYSKPKNNVKELETTEQVEMEMNNFRSFIGGKKVCLLAESSSHIRPPKKEMRDLIAQEMASITKAMAIVTTSPVSRMLANLFFSFKPASYPVKMFSNEEEATAWIKQYV